MRLGLIIAQLGGTLDGGHPDLEVSRLAPLDTATTGSLSFVSQARYANGLDTTKRLQAAIDSANTRPGTMPAIKSLPSETLACQA